LDIKTRPFDSDVPFYFCLGIINRILPLCCRCCDFWVVALGNSVPANRRDPPPRSNWSSPVSAFHLSGDPGQVF